MASQNMQFKYGALNISIPPVIIPVSNQIGSMSQAVTQTIETDAEKNYSNITPAAFNLAAETSNALNQNTKAYNTQQAFNNTVFNAQAGKDAQYQANAIGKQGKKG